jgi:hypothetical protein
MAASNRDLVEAGIVHSALAIGVDHSIGQQNKIECSSRMEQHKLDDKIPEPSCPQLSRWRRGDLQNQSHDVVAVIPVDKKMQKCKNTHKVYENKATNMGTVVSRY